MYERAIGAEDTLVWIRLASVLLLLASHLVMKETGYKAR